MTMLLSVFLLLPEHKPFLPESFLLHPEVAIKLNIAAFSLGVNVGADIYTKLNIDKGLFDFLFKGYHAGETLKVGLPNPVLDTFVYAEVPIGLKLKKFTLNVTPGVFYPVAILDDSDIFATAVNDHKEIKKNYYSSP